MTENAGEENKFSLKITIFLDTNTQEHPQEKIIQTTSLLLKDPTNTAVKFPKFASFSHGTAEFTNTEIFVCYFSCYILWRLVPLIALRVLVIPPARPLFQVQYSSCIRVPIKDLCGRPRSVGNPVNSRKI